MKINTGFCKTSIFYKQFTRKRHVCGVIVRLSAGTARELPPRAFERKGSKRAASALLRRFVFFARLSRYSQIFAVARVIARLLLSAL